MKEADRGFGENEILPSLLSAKTNNFTQKEMDEQQRASGFHSSRMRVQI